MSENECGELERLATAAASMDYSIPLVVGQRSQDSERHIVTHIMPNTTEVITTHNQGQQVISYIEPFQITRGQQLIPVRAYEPYGQDSVHGVQSIHNSRLVMVTPENQFGTRPMTQFVTGVGGIHYQTPTLEILADSVQPVVPSPEASELHLSNACAQTSEFPASPLPEEPTDVVPEKHKSQGIAKRVVSKRLAKSIAKKKELQAKMVTSETVASTSRASGTFVCVTCDESFHTEQLLKSHAADHKISKRSGLTLETKVDIIKRVGAGEKRADIAEEYHVNKSTIKSIMKKSDNYLVCWKKGRFNPETKRMKGPKREDVEQALYSWYKQSIENGSHVSGPTLCLKAMDFAKKLGYVDFKPSHGWLDRFKKRKKITFGRVPVKRPRDPVQTDDSLINEWQSSTLPQVVYEYDANNIFSVEKLGLLYKATPCDVFAMTGKRCAGGVQASDRVSILLCSNMPGKEKLPPLVIGSSRAISRTNFSKALPVHYTFHEKAWITKESFTAWLQDVDSWLLRQNRKICLITGQSPLNAILPKLKCIKYVVTPVGVPCPLQQMCYSSFKRFYRMKVLEELMDIITRGANEGSQPQTIPVISLLTSLSLIAKSWDSVPENYSVSSFQRSGITRYGVWAALGNQEIPDLFGAQEILTRLSSYGYCDNFSFENYTHFDDNLQVCNMMADEDILAEVASSTMEHPPEEPTTELDEQVSTECPSIFELDKAFSGLRELAQYREGTEEAFRLISHLEDLLQKGPMTKPQKKQWIQGNT